MLLAFKLVILIDFYMLFVFIFDKLLHVFSFLYFVVCLYSEVTNAKLLLSLWRILLAENFIVVCNLK